MRVVSFSKDVIRNDITPFSLDGKIEPNFYNAGNTIVYIEGAPVIPGSPFGAGVTNSISQGNVDITFEDQKYDDSKPLLKKLICFYGSLISEDKKEKTKTESEPESDCN